MAEAAPIALPQFGISSFHRIEVVVPRQVVSFAVSRTSSLQSVQLLTHQDDVLLLATNLPGAQVSRQEKSLS